jgi:hypothetical protein
MTIVSLSVRTLVSLSSTGVGFVGGGVLTHPEINAKMKINIKGIFIA